MQGQEIFLSARKIFGECSKVSDTMGLLVGGGGLGLGYLKSQIKFCCDQWGRNAV